MIAVLILVFSISALGKFCLFYCRSIVAAYARVEISPAAQKLAGLGSSHPSGDSFRRILSLASLCPSPAEDAPKQIIVRLYFFVVSAAKLVIPMASVGLWAEEQRAACAHFAAVILDRRIATSEAATC